MGIVSGIADRAVAQATEGRAMQHGLTLDDAELQAALGHRESRAGPHINQGTALTLSPVFAAVRRLSEDVAKTPRRLFQELERGRERQRGHRLDRLVSRRVNPEMSAFKFFEILQGHLPTWGNAYAEMQLDGAGRVVAFWPLTPDRVRRERVGGSDRGEVIYWVRVDDREIALPPTRVLHVQGFGWDGEGGLSVIRLARESLGLTAAAERFGAQHFGRGSRVAGVLQAEGKFENREAKENLRKDFERMHQGLDNSHRVAILDQGVTWQQIGVPPEDAQFLETRKFQVNEVARWFLMPPHKLMDLERSTFSNIEHQAIEYVQDTLVSWYTRWEEELAAQVLTAQEEEEGLYFDFNENALLRGDIQARAQMHREMFNMGAASPNDIRELEEMNPVPGGDTRFVPMNVMPLELAGQAPEPSPAPEGEGDEGSPDPEQASERSAWTEERRQRSAQNRVRLRERHKQLFARDARAVLRQEADAIRSALGRAQRAAQDQKLGEIGHRRKLTDAEEKEVREVALGRFKELVNEFYEDHPERVANRFLGVLEAYASTVADTAADEVAGEVPDNLEEFVRGYADTMGRRWTGISANEIRALIRETDPDEIEEAIDERLQHWDEERPEQEADREVVEAGEAVARVVWTASGVTTLVWVAQGQGCDLCIEMDGRAVGIEAPFLSAGHEVDPDSEDTAPLAVRGDVSHPPLHRGCVCVIVPA